MTDFHRPTATFPSGAYNATQVRLYGIDAMSTFPPTSESQNTFELGDLQFSISPKIANEEAPSSSSSQYYFLPVDVKGQGFAFIATFDDGSNTTSLGIIYGYSYEGHCFDLPKPKIMLLPIGPTDIPDDDCGYDKKKGDGYRLWIVDKLDECVEIEVNSGFIEQLVLEANLPGKRSPSTYRATMAVSHRNGRLME